MISLELAQRLDLAGVRWRPIGGDRFTVRSDEMMGEVFTIAEMVVEAREHPNATLLSFNGTTEWALDSVQLDEALWLPLEHQLRELLGASFRSLTRSEHGYLVEIELPGRGEQHFAAAEPENAYAQAVLALIEAARL
ncbi:MAG: pilus assembly protein CpaE [Propionicimonas sp.]